MKLKFLKILELDGNKINDFSPLLNASFPAVMERINIDR
jgi:Leucine-rich repeat (LRR) protein